jgi:hypothetical protein
VEQGTLRVEGQLATGATTREVYFCGDCSVGAHSYFGGSAQVFLSDIGRYCSIADGVVIGARAHLTDRLSTHPKIGGEPDEHHRVRIGHDVWIGVKAIVMPGITIGNGAVVGAGAVVTKDIPPYAIVAGVPARLLRFRFDDRTIDRLQKVAWWRYQIDRLDPPLDYSNIADTLERIDRGALPLLAPAEVKHIGIKSGNRRRRSGQPKSIG